MYLYLNTVSKQLEHVMDFLNNQTTSPMTEDELILLTRKIEIMSRRTV